MTSPAADRAELLTQLADLCHTHGIPVTPGVLTQFPTGVAVVYCKPHGLDADALDAVIKAASPTLAVFDAAVDVRGVLTPRAWLIGGRILLAWDEAAMAAGDGLDPGGPPDSCDALTSEQMLAYARAIAADPDFALALTRPMRVAHAAKLLEAKAVTVDEGELREIVRRAEVVFEHELGRVRPKKR